jgi:GNAT superfamily N-acetyltransferase
MVEHNVARRTPITYRLASGPDDFAPTYELFLRAANDLRAKSHRDQLQDTVARRTRALAFRQHVFTNDAGGFWIAEANGDRVGFGIGTARQTFWHLNALHVLPEFQSRGVGRNLLHRCKEYGGGPTPVATVISEATQPISNALYASEGMYQWLPLVHVNCATFGSETDAVATIATGDESTLAALDRIDEVVLGFTRSIDHRFWIGLPDVTLVLLGQAPDVLGYAYVSRFGGIGPCATRSPNHLPELLAHSINVAGEQGIARVGFVVPGVASTALAYLLRHSARYDNDMTVLLSSSPFGRLDRYLLPASDALF